MLSVTTSSEPFFFISLSCALKNLFVKLNQYIINSLWQHLHLFFKRLNNLKRLLLLRQLLLIVIFLTNLLHLFLVQFLPFGDFFIALP